MGYLTLLDAAKKAEMIGILIAAGGFAGGVANGLLHGASLGDSLVMGVQGAIFGGISAGIAYGIGHTIPVVKEDAFLKAIAHGITRGAINVAQGGNFKSGFMSAFASKTLGGLNLGLKEGAEKLVFSTLVGGTASKISGGKFANGAVSAAVVYLFNDSTGDKNQVEKYTLGIHTNATEEGMSPIRGHAWISITDNKTGEIHTYALYADQSLPMNESAGTGGIAKDTELDFKRYTWRTNYFVQITQKQYDGIMVYTERTSYWHVDFTCSSFAIHVFNNIVGETFEPTRFPANLAEQIGY
jgi:hypothetical protein